MSTHKPKYEEEYRLGRESRQSGRSVNACPYGMAEIGKRMAWLGGWYDADAEDLA